MTVTTIWAAAVGATLSSGILLMLVGLPMMNRSTVTMRIAPYIHFDTSLHAESTASFKGMVHLIRPVIRVLADQLDRFSIDAEQLARRLASANAGHLSITEYRLQQLASAAAGAVAAIGISLLSAALGHFNGLLMLVGIFAGSVLGVGFRDMALNTTIKRRQQRMVEEFPAIAEMMALAVSAGESAPAAFQRISRICRGELATEFQLVLARMRAGESFPDAARTMQQRADLAPVGRFVDGVLIAVERGTPLAEVMRSQAADVRAIAKRDLMETAGKREIGMMIPLVFGILPLSVVFAVWPGAYVLSLGF